MVEIVDGVAYGKFEDFTDEKDFREKALYAGTAEYPEYEIDIDIEKDTIDGDLFYIGTFVNPIKYSDIPF